MANRQTISHQLTMSWREFERVIGEAFRRRGFTVTGFGGGGPGGGVDLGLAKNGERFLVQCKHWRKLEVGVTVIRELQGIIAALGVHGGYVVTGGYFTPQARDFADSCRIKLIDGASLKELLGGPLSYGPALRNTTTKRSVLPSIGPLKLI
jgi:restriction system protein